MHLRLALLVGALGASTACSGSSTSSTSDASTIDDAALDVAALDSPSDKTFSPDAPSLDAPSLDAPSLDALARDVSPDIAPDVSAPDVTVDRTAPDVTDASTRDTSRPDVEFTYDGPPVDPGDHIWVLRIGDGSITLGSVTAPVFIDRFDGTTGRRTGPPIALPTESSEGVRRLTLGGYRYIDGSLSSPPDGAWVTLCGYDLPVNTSSPATSTADRTLARIDASGSVDTRSAVPGRYFSDSNHPVASALVDGEGFWSLHARSRDYTVVYTTYGAAGTTTTIDPSIIGRTLEIAGGRLITTVLGTTGTGVWATEGLPRTAPQEFTLLPGFPTTQTDAPYGVAALDTDDNGAIDLLFMSIAGNPAVTGGINVWRLTVATWTHVANVSGVRASIHDLVARRDGADYVLYGTTDTTITELHRLAVNGSTWAATDTVLATGSTNELLRGIAFAPR